MWWMNDGQWSALVLKSGAKTHHFRLASLPVSDARALGGWDQLEGCNGRSGRARHGCYWIEIWKGTRKKSGEISSYCWPLLPYTSTNLTSNHSDHCLGVCLQLAPICGRLHSSPGVAEALTALKWLYCFKYGAQSRRDTCVQVSFWVVEMVL